VKSGQPSEKILHNKSKIFLGDEVEKRKGWAVEEWRIQDDGDDPELRLSNPVRSVRDSLRSEKRCNISATPPSLAFDLEAP
jgi:hypothetical protein